MFISLGTFHHNNDHVYYSLHGHVIGTVIPARTTVEETESNVEIQCCLSLHYASHR